MIVETHNINADIINSLLNSQIIPVLILIGIVIIVYFYIKVGFWKFLGTILAILMLWLLVFVVWAMFFFRWG